MNTSATGVNVGVSALSPRGTTSDKSKVMHVMAWPNYHPGTAQPVNTQQSEVDAPATSAGHQAPPRDIRAGLRFTGPGQTTEASLMNTAPVERLKQMSPPPSPPRLPHPPNVRSAAAAEWPLAAEPSAVRTGRQLARAQLHSWRLNAVADDSSLVVSELLTNAVRATTDALATDAALAARPHLTSWFITPIIRLRLRIAVGRLFCEVWDCSCDAPVVVEPEDLELFAQSGRGLRIVNSYAASWGYYYPRENGGKIVWGAFDIADGNRCAACGEPHESGSPQTPSVCDARRPSNDHETL